MKSFVLVIGLSGLFFTLQAQDRVLAGYIVKNSGDTLHGMLKEQGAAESTKQISFKASATDKDYQIYTPDQVKSFQYDSGNLFRAVTYQDTRVGAGTEAVAGTGTVAVAKTCYGQLLVTGEYDLYCFTEDGVLYFLAHKDNNFNLIYDDDLRTMTGAKGNFRSELNFFGSTCDAMHREIESTGYTVTGLITFFQHLDACLGPDKPVQSYYHTTKGYSGFLAYVGGMGYGSRGQFTAEVRWRRIWPQLDPNLSFNIGLRFASVVKPANGADSGAGKVQANYQIFSIPVTAQYNFSILKGRIQPFVFAGLSLSTANVSAAIPLADNSSAKGFVLGVGLQVKITHCLWVMGEWREEYLSQIPTVGLAVILP